MPAPKKKAAKKAAPKKKGGKKNPKITIGGIEYSANELEQSMQAWERGESVPTNPYDGE